MNIWRIRERNGRYRCKSIQLEHYYKRCFYFNYRNRKLSDMRFSHTDLTPFTTFNDVLEHFNKSIVTLKNFTSSDALKMEQAGQNKIDDDAHEAGAIASGGLLP